MKNKRNLIQISIFAAVLIVMATITVKGAPGPVSVSGGGTGTSTIPSVGQLLIGNGTDYSLSTLIPGLGIIVSNSAGSVSIANNGVLSLVGTPNQVNVSSATGTITLSLPQNVTTSSSPTFSGLSLVGGGITFPDATTQTTAAPAGIPVGTIVSYASTTAPTGWLLADGSAVFRTTYSNLFGLIGTRYGAGDGSTTFNLPRMSALADVQSGIVLNWHMDESSGSTISDSSGNNNHGTANGTIVVVGKTGNARNFNGTSDYAVSNSNTGITGSSAWTTSVWYKKISQGATAGNIISLGQYGTSKQVFAFEAGNAGNDQLFLNFWDGGLNDSWNSGVDFTNGFHYVVAVYDGSNNVYVYVDGILNHTKTGVGAMSLVNNPVRVGGQAGGYNGEYLNGYVDEARIYSRALSQDEINNLYSYNYTNNLIKY